MQFTAKTVELAVENGLSELGISKEQAEIIIIEQPTKGLFGRIKGQAVVDIVKKEEFEVKEVKKVKEVKEEQNKTEEKVVVENETLKFAKTLVSFLDETAIVEQSKEKGKTEFVIKSKDSATLIGKKGEIIDAIQTLVGAKENIGRKEYKKVVVDCENYRAKREDTLIKLAKRLEEKATEIRREVVLEPMNPFERRIIHTTLADSKTVTTRSEGVEPNRYLVIVPNDKDEFSKPYSAARNSDKPSYKKKNDRNFRGGNKRPTSSLPKKKSSISFGTYLGNSFKDKEN
jgi:spoIIIJ-associated protein